MVRMMKDILPPSQRRKAYIVFAVVVFALGAIGTGFDAAGVEFPLWLEIANRVALFTGTAFGFVAGGNTPDEPKKLEPLTAIISETDEGYFVDKSDGRSVLLSEQSLSDLVAFLNKEGLTEVVTEDDSLKDRLQERGIAASN